MSSLSSLWCNWTLETSLVLFSLDYLSKDKWGGAREMALWLRMCTVTSTIQDVEIDFVINYHKTKNGKTIVECGVKLKMI